MTWHGTMHGIGKGALEMGAGGGGKRGEGEEGRRCARHSTAQHSTAGQIIAGINKRQTVIQHFVCLPAGDATTGGEV